MKTEEVTVVRIYLTEGEHQFQRLIALLHDEEEVSGLTAFRGIAGFGKSGLLHSSTLLDMSLDLPLVLEFFDHPKKIARVLDNLNSQLQQGRIISWSAQVNTR